MTYIKSSKQRPIGNREDKKAKPLSSQALIMLGLVIVTLCCQAALFSTLVYASEATSDTMPFIDRYFYPRTIIVAFSSDAVTYRSGDIPFSIREGVVSTQIDSFNKIAKEHRIVDLEQLYTDVMHPDWNDDGVYIQNIYRLQLENNEDIEHAQLALHQDSSIIWAEYETINRTMEYIPNDPMFNQQWFHRKIESPLAWDYVKGSKEVIVAITDSGAKWNHPDLADNIWINEAELPGITINWDTAQILGGDGIDNDQNGKIDDVMGWDFFHSNNNPYQNFPGNHHGTHVAGTVGAVGDNEIGITGVAMSVSLMICKGQSSFEESQHIRNGYDMIYYAAQTGAHIINCSWGGPGNGNQANNIINYANNLGSLVIAAAGNENEEHTPTYQSFPANATNAMNIAATDNTDRKANFSDYGDDVDISAPGVNILSTWGNNGYNSTSGTSMAAPVVSGVAALLKTLHPNMTNVQMRQRLRDTSDYIDDINQNYIGKLGTGRVNAFAATMYDKVPKISLIDSSIQEYDGDNDGVPNPGDTINLSISLYNEIYWMPATGVTATLSSNMPGVQIVTETVDIPNIHGGSVSFNTNNPLRFRTGDMFSEYSVPLTITVRANQDGEYPYYVNIDFEVELSLQKAGWPLALTGASTSPALIADVNGDHKMDIVFGDSQGKLHVLREDKSYLPGFPIELGSNINSAVAAADLNGNNSIEIVANTLAGMISCVDNEGNILFQYNTGGQFRNNPMLVDVNNDGNYEIVAMNFTNPKLFVLKSDGTDYPGFPVDLDSGVMSSAASADLNGNGTKEIIFVTSAGDLHAVSTATGTNIEGFPVSLGATSWNGVTVGDLSGNNEPDILVATVQGAVHGYDRTGQRILFRSVGSPVRTAVLAYDLNDDGNSEVIFGDMAGRLFVINSNGVDIEPFPVNVGAAIESTPVLADMTRNGNLDIIFGDTDGWLHSINLQGQNTPNFPVNLNRSLTVSPTIGYVGEVDNVDILIPNQDGYQYVDFKRRAGRLGWRTFKGNMRRTGNSFDMTSIERPDQELLPELTLLKGNYPNPFNPNTTIKYSVGSSEDNMSAGNYVPVNITVYNIRGQAVKTLVNEKQAPGEYRVNWNGTDKTGSQVGSGVYFYMLKTEATEGIQSRRMILVK